MFFIGIFIAGAFMKVLESKKGTLLPINFNSDEECRERGGCFLAGDRRVNENTALASMHTAWVRLHNVYGQLISEEFDKEPQSFESSLKSKEEKDERIFQESRKIVIACLQHIFYEEWLAKLNITLPNYDGYNPNVKAEVSHAFITAAFRFGHTSVPNFFPQLTSNYTRARRPLSTIVNNHPSSTTFQFLKMVLKKLFADYMGIMKRLKTLTQHFQGASRKHFLYLQLKQDFKIFLHLIHSVVEIMDYQVTVSTENNAELVMLYLIAIIHSVYTEMRLEILRHLSN